MRTEWKPQHPLPTTVFPFISIYYDSCIKIAYISQEKAGCGGGPQCIKKERIYYKTALNNKKIPKSDLRQSDERQNRVVDQT